MRRRNKLAYLLSAFKPIEIPYKCALVGYYYGYVRNQEIEGSVKVIESNAKAVARIAIIVNYLSTRHRHRKGLEHNKIGDLKA